MIETDTYNVQRGITQNCFSTSYVSCTLHVIQCWLIFLWRFMTILLLTNHRGIILKIYIQELWFLRCARRLMLVSISVKFHEEILNGFQVTRFCHWNCYLQSSKGHDSKNIYWRFMVLAICTLSKAAFPRAKFLCHILHALQSLLTDFCGIITVNLYSRTDTDEKWINNNYNFGINDCRACNLWQRKFGRVLEP